MSSTQFSIKSVLSSNYFQFQFMVKQLILLAAEKKGLKWFEGF